MKNNIDIFNFLAQSNTSEDLEISELLESRKSINRKRFIAEIKKRNRKKIVPLIISIAACVSVIAVLLPLAYDKMNRETSVVSKNESNTIIKADTSQDIKLILSDGSSLLLSNSREEIYADGETNIVKQDEKAISYVSTTGAISAVKYNTIVVPKGKTYNITLADGTKVMLNSDSRLIFPTRFDGETREVTLEGEAFFEVSHNASKPFLVRSGAITTHVLGTEFNVKAYLEEQNSTVTLLSGMVAVDVGVNSEVLGVGEMLSYDEKNNSVVVRDVDVDDVVAWRKGELVFIHEKIEDVLNKISRSYNVTIKYEIEYPITIYHRSATYQTIEELLKVLELNGKIKYTKDSNNHYTVKSV